FFRTSFCSCLFTSSSSSTSSASIVPYILCIKSPHLAVCLSACSLNTTSPSLLTDTQAALAYTRHSHAHTSSAQYRKEYEPTTLQRVLYPHFNNNNNSNNSNSNKPHCCHQPIARSFCQHSLFFCARTLLFCTKQNAKKKSLNNVYQLSLGDALLFSACVCCRWSDPGHDLEPTSATSTTATTATAAAAL
ncbi:hypothetical protein BDB00DRAFT_942995, partial [Zychaea mexicana]|uniref:uncharacterized protein n=1 Tax=Zychaea mexicana TaxID=64656 RepID=UPI0022FDDF07